MKIRTLITAKKAIVSFMQEKMSPKLSYKLMKFLSEIETEENFFNEKVREIINVYGEKDDSGELIVIDNKIKIQECSEEDCNRAFFELESVEVESPSIRFTIDELSELRLSIEDMIALNAFIVEE